MCAFTYKDSPLSHGVLHLVSPNDLSLLEHLESVKLPVVPLLDQHYLSIRAFADDGYHLKVILGNVASSYPLLLCDDLLVLHFELLVLHSLLLLAQLPELLLLLFLSRLLSITAVNLHILF